MTFIPNAFPKLWTRKEGLREVSKKCRFTVPFDKQNGKDAEAPFKSSQRHLYHTFWSPIVISSLKTALLVICKMLWLFVNIFTSDDKCSQPKRDSLTEPFQMQVSQKIKASCEFCSVVLKSTFNFKHCQKKMTFRANVFPKLRTGKEALR